MTKASLEGLPHELLDQVLEYLPAARDIARLCLVNRAFHTYVEAGGWSVFARSKFYWIDQAHVQSWRSVARSLTTVNRAWDRRAFVIRDLEPKGDIVEYPKASRSETWKTPGGQTMGFVPKIDVYEKQSGSRAQTEIVAFSAGAQFCIRSRLCKFKNGEKTLDSTRWATYLPVSAREGRDDITGLQLLRNGSSKSGQQVIVGTANGDLQMVEVPLNIGQSSIKTYFATQGSPVQSLSLWQTKNTAPLLAAALGGTRIALFDVDPKRPKIAASSTFDYRTPDDVHAAFTAPSCRIWTTQFLSENQLALGIGGSEHPLVYHAIRPTGLDRDATRYFGGLGEDRKPYRANAIYAITPLLENEQVFFTGAYDGIIRMHDLRSPQQTVANFTSKTTDSAIYSILVRGRHTLLAGLSEHEVLHGYDLRYGQSSYYYTDALDEKPSRVLGRQFNVYLSDGMGPSRRLNRRRDGSVYSLASSGVDSPKIFMGLQDTILELAATEVAHRHPDPLHFTPWPSHKRKKRQYHWNGWTEAETRNVSLYDSQRLILQTELMSAWTEDKRRMEPREDGWPLDSRYRWIPQKA